MLGRVETLPPLRFGLLADAPMAPPRDSPAVPVFERAAAPRVWKQDRSSLSEFQSPEEQRPELQRTRWMTGMRLPQYNPKPYVVVTVVWGETVPATATRVDCEVEPGPAHQKTRRTLKGVPVVRLAQFTVACPFPNVSVQIH